jgi:hypothetical protein
MALRVQALQKVGVKVRRRHRGTRDAPALQWRSAGADKFAMREASRATRGLRRAEHQREPDTVDV